MSEYLRTARGGRNFAEGRMVAFGVAATKRPPYNVSTRSIIESSPEIMGGATFFVGTRVPVETLMDYLEAGDSITEFLDDFPTVSREQVIRALEWMKSSLVGAAVR